MCTEKNAKQSFESLKKGLLGLLQDKSYGDNTLKNYHRKLKQLERYMSSNGIVSYEPSVGQLYIDDTLTRHTLSRSGQQFLRTVIRRLDDFGNGTYRIQCKAAHTTLLPSCAVSLDAYLQKCRADGNRETTISGKAAFLREFLANLSMLGCQDIRNVDAHVIGKACLMQGNRDGWAVIKMFLKYLNQSMLIDHDYSGIVPRFRRPFHLPSTYTEAEIKRFEEAIDPTTRIGKRDYAMLLLATRLGMRSGDISGLTFSALDFESSAINILQEKTGESLRLPMLPTIKSALIDYLENSRPESGLPYIFLRASAPFERITTSVIRFEATRYFTEAGISITGKKHGPHAFRSSLASSMINHTTSYDVVRKALGHSDANAVKHYAKVDIERLREYAIGPPEPSGSFKAILEGGQRR